MPAGSSGHARNGKSESDINLNYFPQEGPTHGRKRIDQQRRKTQRRKESRIDQRREGQSTRHRTADIAEAPSEALSWARRRRRSASNLYHLHAPWPRSD
jgi:hypothetical protein